MKQLMYIDIKDLVHDPDNPKGRTRNTADLQYSIATVGLLSPLAVQIVGEQIIVRAGNRRLTALNALKRKHVDVPNVLYTAIPCVAWEGEDDAQPVMAAASNVQRQFLPSQLAIMLVEVIISKRWPVTKAARALGIKTAEAKRLIRLADAPKVIQDKVDDGSMSWSAFDQWRNAPQDVQEEVAQHEGQVTATRVKGMRKRHQKKVQPQIENGALPDEVSVVEELNRIYDYLLDVTAQPVGVREKHVLGKIAELFE